ncbi:MAG: alpha-galactosidase [Ilumatobacteraceae bacterium]
MSTLVHLAGRDVDVVVDPRGPTIVHWGSRVDATDLGALLAARARPVVHGAPDVVAPITVVPEHGAGFPGRPGLCGHRRRGAHWAPPFRTVDHHLVDGTLTVVSADDVARLTLVTRYSLDDTLVLTAEIINDAPDERYLLDALTVTLPLPETASDLLTFDGRWTREFHPVRETWTRGARTAENRRGRTSHEHPPLLFVGTPGFGEWAGEVWGAHVAWSGNHSWYAERLPDGRRYLQLGELLHPGEVSLEPGGRYRTPEIVAVHSGEGLTAATQRYHRHLRARPSHPVRPRPVLVNTWEAVYFDHDATRLAALAERAASIGAERFVLDDGWFGSRRNDSSGLGDWEVSPDAHPDGLTPLIDLVTGLGMEFGIWVEPEMVNIDSDLYRSHPEWTLSSEGYEPVLARHQLVVDLSRDDARAHVLARLDALLSDHEIAFVKWDMNRDHVAASGADGAAATRAQTLAVLSMLDELRARHPTVEFESCASGGGRIDFEILRRAERVWTSDCNDPLERQTIQHGASMLIPPELMGAHIGPARSHTTGRRHDLSFRAATALFGHLGVEADLLALDDRELAELAEVVALHQRFRPLLHGGDVVRFDTEPDLIAHGVHATDRSESLVSIARLSTGPSLTPPPLTIPGLLPDSRYRVELVELPGRRRPGPERRPPQWVSDGIELSGRGLGSIGLQLPAMHPETALLIHLRTTGT